MVKSSSGIFGKILILDSKSATIVFICVLSFFMLFEALLHVFEVACNKRGFKGLVKKLYREFMIMGIISFVIYIASEIFSFPNDIWFNSFNFAHIVLVFIGLTFLLQAVLLVSLITSRNRTLLKHSNSTSDGLITEYVAMHKRGGLTMLMFDHGPVSIPFPELREKIEYKILQQFFIKVYNLPHEFKFANYMCSVLKDYVVSLVEVRPISWLLISACVALNYLKVVAIDPLYQHDLCKRYPGADLLASRALRALAGTAVADGEGYGDHICDEYTLRYAFVVLMMIGVYLLIVLIASEVYTKRLINIVLDQQELEANQSPANDELDENTAINRGSLHLRRSSRDFRGTDDSENTPATVDADIEMGHLTPVSGSGSEFTSNPQRLTTRHSTPDSTSSTSAASDNRRNRYLDGLERLMAIEINHQMALASRMSLTEHDGAIKDNMAAASASASAKSNHGLSTSSKFGGFEIPSFYSSINISRIDSLPLPGHAVHRCSNTSAASADKPPTGEELRARFQRMQTVGQELKEMRCQHPAHSKSPLPFRLLGTSESRVASPRERKGTLFGFVSGGRTESSTTAAAPVPSTSKRGHRNRSYSVNYFDMRPAVVEQEDEDSSTSWIEWAERSGRALSGWLWRGAGEVGSMLVEHQIGNSKEDADVDEDIKLLKKEFDRIFAFSQPEFYYIAVEMALLIQCVYIALWATNFVSMAEASNFPIRWQLLLVFPLPINFFLLKQIIFTSCMLKSILAIDKHVADKICEDAVDEQNVTQRLRRLIRREVSRLTPRKDRLEAQQFLKEKFNTFVKIDDYDTEGVNEKHFKLFLHSLQIFLTDASIKGIFGVIDFDKDSMVTWDDLCRIVFPDLQGKRVKVNKRASTLHKKRLSFDLEHVESCFSSSTEPTGSGPAEQQHSEPHFLQSTSNNSVTPFTGSFLVPLPSSHQPEISGADDSVYEESDLEDGDHDASDNEESRVQYFEV